MKITEKEVADHLDDSAHVLITQPELAVDTETPVESLRRLPLATLLEKTGSSEVDNTLTKSGQAADAKIVGDKFNKLSEEKVNLPKDTDGNIIPGTTGWYAVSDGAGGITWVESAPSTGDDSGDSGDSGGDSGDTGGDTGGSADTSPVIDGYDQALNTSGGADNIPGGCYTGFYAIPDGAGSVTLYLADFESVAFGSAGKLQYWDDAEFLEYWTASANRNAEKTYALKTGATRFRTSLATNGVDDSYAYDSATGYVYFAGKNTQYYGMTNINGNTSNETAVSVAAEVDNQITMLSLATGETVDTSAYSGLSSDYVSMVQANYDAMMAECLGDYNKIPLIVHTDQHGRIGASNQVMKLIGDMVNWYEVSKCINLGDTVTDRFGTTELENYLSATKESIPLSKRLDIYGNHDIWDADDEQKYTVDQKRLSPYFKNIYARRHGNNGYFTVVDDYYNVKYLVISDLEYPDTNYSTRRITTAQAKFIVSELSADDGRDIVLVSHVPFDSDDVTSRDNTYSAYSEKFLSDSTAHNSLMDMLAARKNKTAGTFTDSEGVEHAYDFSNVSGDLLMSLHGHAHFEAYRTFENSITEFIFDWFDGNTFAFAYIDRGDKKFKVWKNEADVEALEISIA